MTLLELSFLWDIVESGEIEIGGANPNLWITVIGSDETRTEYTLTEIYEAIDLSGQLLIASENYGDVDKDGIVNLEDVVIVLEALAVEQTGGGTSSKSDLNADGTVDLTDLEIVVDHIINE